MKTLLLQAAKKPHRMKLLHSKHKINIGKIKSIA